MARKHPQIPPGIEPEEYQTAVEAEEKVCREDAERKTDAIKGLWHEKPDLSPNEVQKELARRGVQVSRPMIYKVKQEIRRATLSDQPPSMEDLMELKRLAERFGGLERLKLMLEMLERLQV